MKREKNKTYYGEDVSIGYLNKKCLKFIPNLVWIDDAICLDKEKLNNISDAYEILYS